MNPVADLNHERHPSPQTHAGFVAGDIERAGNDARYAVLFAEADPYAWNALGQAQLAGGFAEEAAASFTKALEMDAEFDAAFVGRFRARVLLGDGAAAVADIEAALAHASADLRPDVLLERGRYRVKSGNVEGGAQDFTEVNELQPGNYEAWVEKAAALRLLARVEEAEAAERQARMLRPTAQPAAGAAAGEAE